MLNTATPHDNLDTILQELEATKLGAPLAKYVRDGDVTVSVTKNHEANVMATYDNQARHIYMRAIRPTSLVHELRHHYQYVTLSSMGIDGLWDVSPQQLFALNHLKEIDAYVHESLFTIQLVQHHTQQGDMHLALQRAFEQSMTALSGSVLISAPMQDAMLNRYMRETARRVMTNYLHENQDSASVYKKLYQDAFVELASGQENIISLASRNMKRSTESLMIAAGIMGISLPFAISGSLMSMAAIAASSLLAYQSIGYAFQASSTISALRDDNDMQVLLQVSKLWGQLPDGSNYLLPKDDQKQAVVLPKLPDDLADKFNAHSRRFEKSWIRTLNNQRTTRKPSVKNTL